ncbi:MAG: ArnT family glycosyltransferase [Anaerolineae bacterium]
MPQPGDEDGSIMQRANMVESRYRHLPILGLLIIYLVIAFIFSVVNLSFEASDELWHYPMVKRLADGQGLPVQRLDQIGPWRQEGSQPPLYYALGALITFGINTDDLNQVRWLNPHADIGLPKPDRNANMVIHTQADQFPYRGTLLALHVVRWFSILLGALTVFSAYLLARQIFQDQLLALTTASLTAFNAMYLFITASVNNDALVIPLSAFALWLMVRYISGRPSIAQWAGLGIVLGLACLSKVSALGLLPLAAITGIVVAYRNRSPKDLVYAGLAILVPILAISGWWYVRNWQLYRDPLGFNAFVAIVGPRYPVPTLGQLLGEWKGFVMAYWGFFGGLNVPAPGWYYWAMSLLGIFGLVASPLYLWRRYKQERFSVRRWWQLALTLTLPVIVFMALVRWTLLTVASQGRLMFPALTAISLWIAMGWVGLFRSRLRYAFPIIASTFMAFTAMIFPFTVISAAYARPALLGKAAIPPITHRLDARFADKVRLLGYDLAPSQVNPGESVSVTLYWQSLTSISENYSVFIHLVDRDDLIVGQRDVYPGQGTFPTSLWQPGDTFADTYVIPVGSTVLTPNQLQVVVGLYQLTDGTRLDIKDAGGSNLGDAIRFGEIIVPLRLVDGIPNPLFTNFANQLALVGYEMDRTSVLPGESIHLILYWQALTDIEANYTVFTHVLGKDERKFAQVDSWPQSGQSPTSTWRKGQIIKDSYELQIASDATPEVAELQIGLYDFKVKRLSILGVGGYVQDTRLVLGKVRILAQVQ